MRSLTLQFESTMDFISELPSRFRSLARFPVPVAISVGLSIFFNFQVAGFFKVSGKTESDIIFAAVGAVGGGLAASLWCRTRQRAAAASALIPMAAAALAAMLLFTQGGVYTQANVALVGLALATMVAAHFRRDASINSFWGFNLQLGIAIAMGLVATLVLCGGLSLLIVSFGYLFDVMVRETIYSHIWTTGGMSIAPLCTLAMIPSNVDEPFVAGASPSLLEQSVFYVLNFALAPLVLAYSVMLHIYAVKLAITMTMPKYETEWMVLIFGAFGTATYMIAYPWRDLGYAPVRWFMRSWFCLMIVPTVMLTLAVWQVTADHGVTTGRYCLWLFAMWLAAMVVYLGMARGRIDVRVIPASLSMLLILSSFGPWGATAVSRRSQLDHFRRLLQSKGVLVDGRLKFEPPPVEKFARLVASDKPLESILETLIDLDALNQIEFVFAGAADDPFLPSPEDGRLRSILGMDGMEELSEDQARSGPASAISGVQNNSIPLNFDGGRYDFMIGPIWVNRQGQINVSVPDSEPCYGGAQIGNIGVTFSTPVLTVSRGATVVSFNLAKAIEPGKQAIKSPSLIPAHEGRDRAALVLVRSSQTPGKDRDKMFEAWILLNSTEASAPG